MKFSPETLLQIYLDGSFTEEAQAEFDKLIRKDPSFAERVTQAVAERVGSIPETQLSAIESKLDARVMDVWQKYKPSPLRQALKLAGGVVALGLGLTGLYLGGSHLLSVYHGSFFTGTSEDRSTVGLDRASSSSNNVPSNAKSSLSTKPALSSAKSGKPAAAASQPASSSVPARGKGIVGLGQQGQATVKTAPASNPAASVPMGAAPSMPAASSMPKSSVLSGGAPPALPVQSQIAPPPLTQPAPFAGTRTQEGNALRVSIETQKTQSVVVNVLDAKGLLVRRLYQGAWEPGNHQVDWDGKDEMGNPVPPGDYTVTVNADGKTMSGVVTVKPNQ